MWVPVLTHCLFRFLGRSFPALKNGTNPLGCQLVVASGIINANSLAGSPEVSIMFSRLFQCRGCGGLNGYRSRPKDFTEKYLCH